MNDLGTALRQLASEAQPPTVGDPADLWQQGRRRVRAGRISAAGIVLAVLMVGAGIGTTGPEPLLAPASSPASAGIPDRVVTPPGWIPTTRTPEPLALLGSYDSGEEPEKVFGIEAATGNYRFLDLPGRTPATPVALSPNGRHVAFWSGDAEGTTGLTVLELDHGTMEGLDGGAPSSTRITGKAITWLDDETVLLSYDTQAGDGEPARTWTETWKTVTGGPLDIKVWSIWTLDRDGSVLFDDNEDLEPGAPVHWARRIPGSGVGTVPLKADRSGFFLPSGDYRAVSSSGMTVVALARSGEGLALRYGTADATGTVVRLDETADLDVARLLGWTSAGSVLVSGTRGSGEPGLYSVDLATGTATRRGAAGDDPTTVVAVAADLLEKPMVAGNPPRGMDPRIAGGLLLGALLVAVVGVIRWRRRARQ